MLQQTEREGEKKIGNELVKSDVKNKTEMDKLGKWQSLS